MVHVLIIDFAQNICGCDYYNYTVKGKHFVTYYRGVVYLVYS